MNSSSTTTSNSRILQINISRGGLPKRPIPEGHLTTTGFEGDACAHPQIHGGPAQAVLLIASEAIEILRAAGYPVYAGALGENLTTEGLDPSTWRPGQQYRAGQAILELTKSRQPCNALNVYGPAIKQALGNGRGGFYARVIRPGLIFPNDPIILLSDLA